METNLKMNRGLGGTVQGLRVLGSGPTLGDVPIIQTPTPRASQYDGNGGSSGSPNNRLAHLFCGSSACCFRSGV